MKKQELLNMLNKKADLMVGPKKGKGKTVAGGIFIGTGENHKEKSKELVSLLKEKRSLQKTKKSYQEKYPKDFVTVAIKREAKPNFFKFKKRKEFKERTKSPKIHLAVGKSGGPMQTEFYNDVFGAKMKHKPIPKDLVNKVMNKNAGRVLQLLTGSKARQLGAKAKSLSKSDPIGAGVAESKQALEKAKSLATQGVAAAGVATGGAVGLKHLKEKNMNKKAAQGIPSYEEVVPLDNFRRGAGIAGSVIYGLPLGGTAAYMTAKALKNSGKASRIFTTLGVGLGGVYAGDLAGRATFGSYKRYKQGKESYYSQLEDPEHRKKFLKAWNKEKTTNPS